jgi:hypothetical protein
MALFTLQNTHRAHPRISIVSTYSLAEDEEEVFLN